MSTIKLCSGVGKYHTNKNGGTLDAISWQEILAMVDAPPQVDKDNARWVIPSTLPSRVHKEQEQRGTFYMHWLDIDKGSVPLERLVEVIKSIAGDVAMEIYSSRSATPETLKWRALIPTAKSLTGAEWLLAQVCLNDALEAAGITPDRASERAGQPCYLPNLGSFYETHSKRSEPILDALAVFASTMAQKRAQEAAQAAELAQQREAAKARRERLSATDAPDAIGAFNQAYTVDAILLQAGYDQRGNTFRHPNSESGSFSASVKDGRVHALSTSDPLFVGIHGKTAHDAFGAFQALFHQGDQKAALKDAGDNWLTIGAESWNTVKQREWAKQQGSNESEQAEQDKSDAPSDGEGYEWPELLPIPDELLPVEPFDVELLPVCIRPWVADIAERMQCPVDFPAVGAMVALSSLIGRKACIYPKRLDNWHVIPNLWGAVVGRPGVMKSPALAEVLKPLDRLASLAKAQFDSEIQNFRIDEKVTEMVAKANEKKAQKLADKGQREAAYEALSANADGDTNQPVLRRYKVTDASVEALGEVLIENPNGVLAYRDELNGLLRSLDKEGQEGGRAFYLQGADGLQSYTFDRILRGKNLHIPAVCIAMLGGIQPGKLQAYIYDAMSGGSSDDGLLQRFGMLVWPDITRQWVNVDRSPDAIASDAAHALFDRLDAMQPTSNALTGDAEPMAYRFTQEAQVIFDDWRAELEAELRAGKHPPAMESHLSKYRKLAPAIALVCALVDGEEAVTHDSLCRALAWCDYLRSHAARAYAAGSKPSAVGAKALLGKITSGAVAEGFKAAEVTRKGWLSLSTTSEVHAAINLLCELGYLRRIETPSGVRGGRPAISYQINPAVMQEQQP